MSTTNDIPIIDIVVSGGVAYVNSCPPGVMVRLRDYDTEGAGNDDANLSKDEDGHDCYESIYTAEDFE